MTVITKQNFPVSQASTVNALFTNIHGESGQTPALESEQNERNVQVLINSPFQRVTKCSTMIWIFLCLLAFAMISTFVAIVLKTSSSTANSSNSENFSNSTDPAPNFNGLGNHRNDFKPKVEPPDFPRPRTKSGVDLFLLLDKSCSGRTCDNAARDTRNFLNTSVSPCENFYNFACQGWQKHNTRPTFAESWNIVRQMDQKTNEIIIEILNEPLRPNDITAVSMAKLYFKSCLKSRSYQNSTKSKAEMQFIWNKLEQYGGWPILHPNETWNSTGFNWMKTVVDLKKEFGSAKFLDVIPYQSQFGNVSDNILFLRSPFSASTCKEPFYKPLAYMEFIVNVCTELLAYKGVLDIDESYLEQKAFEILNIREEFEKLEERQYGKTWEWLDSQDGTVEELDEMLNASFKLNDPNVLTLLKMFYVDTGISINSSLVVNVNLQYIQNVFALISNLSQEALANYLHFEMALQIISLSNEEKLHQFLDALQKGLEGTSSNVPIRLACTEKIKKKFPVAIDHAIIRRQNRNLPQSTSSRQINAPHENFKKVRQMFDKIQLAFLTLIANSSLSFISKPLLESDTQAITLCLGYPNWITQPTNVEAEYSMANEQKLNLSPSDQISLSYLEQTIIVNKWAANKKLAKLIQPPQVENGCRWEGFLGGAGAWYYSPAAYLPLGILQPPFYDENLPESLLYGRLGVIIGHEIAHGLIGPGWSHDMNGMTTPVGQCIIDWYSNYSFDHMGYENTFVNGNATLIDNLADNIGLLVAFKAYTKRSFVSKNHKLIGLQEYTNDQLFFIGFAQDFCESTTEEGLRSVLATDMHSPGEARVMGVLQNSKEFAKAWNCPAGSRMNPVPENGKDAQCRMF